MQKPPAINLGIALPTAAPTEAEARAAELEEEEGAKSAIASCPAGPPRPGRGRSMPSQISHRLTEDASQWRRRFGIEEAELWTAMLPRPS